METIIEKLKKIEALATSGIDGERDNAKRLLDALCAKHGVTPEQLINDEKNWVKFTVRSKIEPRLISQVLAYVCRTLKVENYQKGRSFYFKITKAQALDAHEALLHYRDIWEKNVSDYFTAFIHAHKLFPPSEKDKADQEITAEKIKEYERIAQMIHGMKISPWERKLKIESSEISNVKS